VTTISIPPDAIEAAAEAIRPWFNYFAPGGLQPSHAERIEGAAHTALLAALSVGEVRQEWRPAWEYRSSTGKDLWLPAATSTWTENREDAEEHVRSVPVEMKWSDGYPIYRNARVQVRTVVTWSDGTVITTAWRDLEKVPDGE
jgi:hypothetical protein